MQLHVVVVVDVDVVDVLVVVPQFQICKMVYHFVRCFKIKR